MKTQPLKLQAKNKHLITKTIEVERIIMKVKAM
jgi:hypothetical protein